MRRLLFSTVSMASAIGAIALGVAHHEYLAIGSAAVCMFMLGRAMHQPPPRR